LTFCKACVSELAAAISRTVATTGIGAAFGIFYSTTNKLIDFHFNYNN